MHTPNRIVRRRPRSRLLLSMLALVGFSAGCDGSEAMTSVDFASEDVQKARTLACRAHFEAPARVGAAAQPENAGALWAVSPYLVLIPASGVGYVGVHVDAEHFDWLVYTDAADLATESGPKLTYGGPLHHCADKGLREWGTHHVEPSTWLLRVEGEPGSRVRVYVALSATEKSDWADAGHAGHVLGEAAGDAHGGHEPHGG